MSRGLDVALLDIEEGFEECFLTSDFPHISEPAFATSNTKEIEEAITFDVTGEITLSF